MVAIALPNTLPTTSPGRSRRQLPPVGTGRGHRPALRLVPPHGGARTHRPAIRAVLGALAGLALVACAVALALLPAVTPGTAADAPTAPYVAEAGDTMWSIAVAHAPAGEAATYVESLVAANGTAEVSPGQSVTIPAP